MWHRRVAPVPGLGEVVGLEGAHASCEDGGLAIEEHLVARARTLASKGGPQVVAVQDPVAGGLDACERAERRQQIEGRAHVADDGRGHEPRTPEDRRFAHAALERVAFAATQQAGRAPVGVVDQPRPIVRGEDDERPLVEAELLQGGDDPSHAPVDLLDRIGVKTRRVAPGELRRGEERDVHHRVGEVDEEGPFAVRSNELDGLLRIAAGDRVLVGGALDFRFIVEDGDVVVRRIGLPPCVGLRLGTPVRRTGYLVHVVGVGNPPVRREPVPGREMLRQVTEVPLAERPGHVAGIRERLGYGDLFRGEATAGVGKQDPPGVRGQSRCEPGSGP